MWYLLSVESWCGRIIPLRWREIGAAEPSYRTVSPAHLRGSSSHRYHGTFEKSWCEPTRRSAPSRHVSAVPSSEMVARSVLLLRVSENQSTYEKVTSASRALSQRPDALLQPPCHAVSYSPTTRGVSVATEMSISTRLNAPSGRHLSRRYAASSSRTNMPPSPRYETCTIGKAIVGSAGSKATCTMR